MRPHAKPAFPPRLRTLVLASLLLVAANANSRPEQSSRPATLANTPSASVEAAAAPTTPPVPLLWKVSDADNAVYVLGSFHLLKPGDYPLSPDVDAAFADAEKLVFEMAPEEMSSPTLAVTMAQAALRTDGTQLDSEIGPETAARLRAWTTANQAQLAQTGITAEALQRFEPWFVGLTVTLTEMAKQGLDPGLGLDHHMATAAQQAGKPTAGLETGAQQIAFLDGMDKVEQKQMLAEALDESLEGRAATEALHRAWREGDEQTLWNEMAADMKAKYPRLYQAINTDRNDAWLPLIEARLKSEQDDTLLVVGALHTIGSDGIVEKLKARGHTVERICSACAATAPGKASRKRPQKAPADQAKGG